MEHKIDLWKLYCDDITSNNIIKGVGKDAEIVVNENGGKQSKVDYRFDLLDPKAMFEITKVLKEGFDKYGSDENWRRIPIKEHINHLIIHLYAYLAGDTQDEHLSHACCRAIFALAVDIANRNNAQSEDIVN
ncbi:MAG: DUF5664 domain-containing protein [Lachnospiraceae bacterium]|nr:DUF5664 domain-containing protein [Lachnospiraceae bacterium]